MTDSLHAELDKLIASVAGLEAQRSFLGDSIVQPAIDSLQEKISALKTQLQPISVRREERRIVTILFCDLVGSTSLASRFDPEDWREVIARVHELAGAQVYKFNGTVLQYLGDGMLAVFGAKRAMESDPENALQAALAIQANMNRAGGVGLPGNLTLQMRMGLHTGLVVIGELGSETKTELTATGDAMNVAARLQSAAPPGGILITHETYRYVRRYFDVQPQPPLMVKGKDEPLRTYLVLKARPSRFKKTAHGVGGISTPMIGREQELSQLRAAYDQVLDQHEVRWMQVIGEPGVGKSRLVDEMRCLLPKPGHNFHLFKTRLFPGDENQPYMAVRRMWMSYFHIPEDIPPEDIEVHWMAAVSDLARSDARLPADVSLVAESARALGFLLGLPLSASPLVQGVKPAQLKDYTVAFSRQLLTTLSQSGTLVVLIEDIHWLDQASWEYFTELLLDTAPTQAHENAQKTYSRGVFVLATTRPEWSPPLALCCHTAYSSLTLATLQPDDSRELIRTLLKDVSGVPEQVIKQMVDRSDGIPYFVEELINMFLDLEIIDQQVQPWRFVNAKYQSSLLPDTLQYLLQSRLDSLDEQEKKILQVGAVLGRRFWEGWLDSRLNSPSHDELKSLQSRGQVTRVSKSTFEDEIEWGFEHQAQQEVAYASLLKRLRKELHAAAAGWLEYQAGKANQLDEYASQIGEHAQAGGDAQNAGRWFVRAGKYAFQRAALVEARAFFERSLALLPVSDLQSRWEITLELDEVLGQLADTPARLAMDSLLVSEAQAMGRQDYLAVALYRQGGYLSKIGENTRAAPLLRDSYQNAMQANDLVAASNALGSLVSGLAAIGEVDEASAYAEILTGLAEQCGDELAHAMALVNLSVFYTMAGDHFQAAQLLNQQSVIMRNLNYRMFEATSLSNLGYTYIVLGQYPLGIVTLEKALELLNAYGMLHDAAFAQLNLGLAYSQVGDFDSATRVLETACQRLAETQDTYGMAAGMFYLGLACEKHADPHLAKSWFLQAKQKYNEVGARASVMECQAGLLRCAIALGNRASSKALLEELWDYLQAKPESGMEFPVLAYQACVIGFEIIGDQAGMAKALQAGSRLLEERASRIRDLNWRQGFYENIAENQWLLTRTANSQTNLA